MKRIFNLRENRLILSFDYNKELVEEIKLIDYKERSYDPISRQWTISITIMNREVVNTLLDKWGFKSEEEIDTANNIDYYIKQKSRLNLIQSYQDKIEQIDTKIKPYLYQVEGINYQCSWTNMINGDDMGIGKTYQTIFSAEIMDRFPCLVICPSSTKYQWKEFWGVINKNRSVSIIDSKEVENWTTDVVIINYDLIGVNEKYVNEKGEDKIRHLVKYKELLSIKWKYAIIDEIHMAKSSKSLRGVITKKITDNISCVHGLTGTLIENKPVELIHPLSIIRVFDDIFGNWVTFTNRYCDAKDTRYGKDVSGSSHTLELNKLLRATCYLRREKREVLKDLPEIQESILNIEITNYKEYINAEDDFIQYMRNNYSKMKVDSALMAEFLVQRNHLRQLSVKGKLKGISDWLEDFIDQSNEKVLVVGNFTSPLTKLSIEFNGELIDGDMDAKQKREAILRWQKDDKQFLFANCKAVGTGTDGLQENCSILVVIDLPDKPSILDQTISRIERIGVKNFISVYYLLCRDTIDMKLWDMVEDKKKITEAINKGQEYDKIDSTLYMMQKYLNK
jgi:SWI/SNF-related matrix-associated actin-dependent regulator 1 of chromatin subfamily A